MNVLGIIAEYNPFHNGHLYHLRQCREKAEADFVVAVMSGNFTQRGEPAIMDKWARSRIAVECGVDLVLELPFAYAVNSAEYFARGGIGILEGLGCVTHLGFGAEKGHPDELRQAAVYLAKEPDAFRSLLKKNLDAGLSYAKARESALAQIMGPRFSELSVTPNNILALEYLKQLQLHNSSIKFVMVNRKGAGYLDKEPKAGIASATAIRNHLDPGQVDQYVPQETAEALRQAPPLRGYFDLIRGAVLSRSADRLAQIFSVGEGLENRIKDQIRRADNLESLVEKIASKRYPKTRISRILCQILMDLTSLDGSLYARVLAAGNGGTRLLREIKKTAKIPVITNINKVASLPGLCEKDILASDMYNLLTGASLYENCDYVRHPYIRGD
ncbi:nucleotidyltransferase [Anaerovorax odorimutans]|uniref:tRNA(Met) cytidine acetate ligase n=1 Tax=Anaerovorax odorimutans TaxID=109327 RepID=A0ABT1RQE2_9FIRM|nr:nucleotidyltransferase [Anaerovorax odorimutans]MCQ4637417.1 nucleotidyltransferase [Anaerovorax odorimutans]